jgi:hypothetical protein
MAENITRPETIRNVHEDDEGTGIYWFVDDTSGQYEQVFVPRITGKRAEELATDFDRPGKQRLDAYRWVPDQVESAQSLVGKLCGGKCQKDLDCIDNACRCIKNRCRRK